MKHLNAMTIAKRDVPQPAQDAAGMIFLQVWAMVFGWILFGAFSEKG